MDSSPCAPRAAWRRRSSSNVSEEQESIMAGPLKGIRIIEFAGIGPGPFCGMRLADHRAEAIRTDPTAGVGVPPTRMRRNRTSVPLDMEKQAPVTTARTLNTEASSVGKGRERTRKK